MVWDGVAVAGLLPVTRDILKSCGPDMAVAGLGDAAAAGGRAAGVFAGHEPEVAHELAQ